MKINFSLTPSERRRYQTDIQFKEYYNLKLEVFDLINDYIDREFAVKGMSECNQYLKEVFLPSLEISFSQYMGMTIRGFRGIDKESEH